LSNGDKAERGCAALRLDAPEPALSLCCALWLSETFSYIITFRILSDPNATRKYRAVFVMFDVSRYTVGWVCAIPTERLAARLILDEEHDYTEYESPLNDNNTYSFGSIGRHNVVIAALPSGEYGISNATGVARDLLRSFTNVRIALMVGIGGGAPLVGPGLKQKRDIRLGDVVVSKPGAGQGGVLQYDFGKVVQNRAFLPTGHLNQPPAFLLTALGALEDEYKFPGINIDKDISVLLAKYSEQSKQGRLLQKEYRRPDTATDRLYKSDFIHPDDNQECSKTCDHIENVVVRDARDDEEDVVIHQGLIASANSLMKDAHLRDTFARDLSILCFEMEAAGLMNQFPFLVIRGICDYSDTHKSKEWQRYAALTSAMYARRLLLRVAPNRVEAETKLSELQKSLQQGM
jgi:nucleoside phosphorylase